MNKLMDGIANTLTAFLFLFGAIVFSPLLGFFAISLGWNYVYYRGWRNPEWDGLDWQKELIFKPEDRTPDIQKMLRGSRWEHEAKVYTKGGPA